MALAASTNQAHQAMAESRSPRKLAAAVGCNSPDVVPERPVVALEFRGRQTQSRILKFVNNIYIQWVGK